MLFEITPNDIASLSDSHLRELVGRLAEQEVRQAGHSPATVTYGGHQNAADGGIDVRVNLPTTAEMSGYVPRAATGYQVKAETMPPSKIKTEMCPNGDLRPSIQALGRSDAGGAYVIVSSRDSVSDTALRTRCHAMKQAVTGTLPDAGLYLDFYGTKRLASWVNQHPGLIPWVRIHAGNPLSGWQPFEDWSSSPSAVDAEYLLDNETRIAGVQLDDADGLNTLDGINLMRKTLSEPAGIVRVLGLSGVGKTRLVQALFDERIGHDHLAPALAVYTDLADEPEPAPLELLKRLLHLQARCALIVDNCGADLHRKLSQKINATPGRVSLITVEYDIAEDEPEYTSVFRLEPVSATVLENILEHKYTDLSRQEIRTITAFSEGNARIAIALANTARHGDSLANLQDTDLFNRLFRQKNEDNPALLKAGKACSLVYSFDGETLDGGSAELPVLAALAGQSSSELYAHVAELRRRQLVQARSHWRAVLPHAVAHKLAKYALQDTPLDILKRILISDETPKRLIKSFTRRLGQLHDSTQAQVLAAECLGQDGQLSEIDHLNDFAAELFVNLAPINPSLTLQAIQRAHKRSNAFSENDRQRSALVVRTLQSLAYDSELFDESINLIAGFARGREKSNDTGDPINVFKSLFQIRTSGTHATIQQRIATLTSLARSANVDDQELALAGLGCLLQCNNFHIRHDHGFGARRRDFGYLPRSDDDVRAWFVPAFALCLELMGHGGIFPRRVRQIVAEKFPSIALATKLLDEIVDLANDMARSHGWPEGWAAVRKTISWAEQRERTEITATLAALSTRLQPSTLADRIATYVVPPRWSPLDIANINTSSLDSVEKANQQVESACREIGRELAGDPSLLKTYLPDVLHARSGRIYSVAESIAKNSADPKIVWQTIADDHVTRSFPDSIQSLLAGFLSGLSRTAPHVAAECLDRTLASDPLHPYFVLMQISAGIDNAGHRRLLDALDTDSVPTPSFQALSFGRVCDGLTGIQLQELLVAISMRDGGLATALDILGMRVHAHCNYGFALDAADKQTARRLLDEIDFQKLDARDTFTISTIIRHCLAPPDDALLVSELAFRLGVASVHHRLFLRDHDQLLSTLTEIFPMALLDGFAMAMQEDSQDMAAISWQFRDDESEASPFHKIDDETVWRWVSVDPAVRTLQAAELVPPFQAKEGSSVLTWTGTALRLIRQPTETMKVLEIFHDWLFPSYWSGSLAAELNKRLPLVKQLAEDSDARVAEWSNETIKHLEADIAAIREREAARSRIQYERFE